MRLIDADALKEWAEEYHASNWGIPQDELIYAIGSAPTIELFSTSGYVTTSTDEPPVVYAEQKHGKWKPAIVARNIDALECSECGAKYPNLLWMPGYSYCPNCGAKMEGSEE